MRRLLLALSAIVAIAAPSREAHAQFQYKDWNSTYNTDTQTLKYTPVRYTSITGDEASCKTAIAARGTPIGTMDHIEFYSDDPVDEFPDQIPMVLITGGRANFLARNLRRPMPDAPGPDLNSIEYWNDWLVGSESKFGRGTVLWYDDRRSQRPLYLVVDYREYANYYLVLKSLLADQTRRVRLVGCRIVASDGSADAVGFGAQRVCAIELMKAQRRQFAWMLDDNIATIKGLTRLSDIEGPMAKQKYMAISFNPDNTRQADTWKSRDEVAKQIQAGTDAFSLDRIVDAGPGDDELMQQAVLWNIEEITRRGLTFSPYFVESAEDLTFTRYLKRLKAPLKVVKGLTVVKITGDNTSPYTGPGGAFARRFAGYAQEALQNAKAKYAHADNAMHFQLAGGQVLPVGAFVQTLPVDAKSGPMLGSVRITTESRDVDGKPVEDPRVTSRKIVENTLLYCLDRFPRLFDPMFTSPVPRVVFAQSPLRAYMTLQGAVLHAPHDDVARVVTARFTQRLLDLRFSILYTAARVQLLREALDATDVDASELTALENASQQLIDASAEVGGVWAEGGPNDETVDYLHALLVVALPKEIASLRSHLDAVRGILGGAQALAAVTSELDALDVVAKQAQDDFAKLDIRDFVTR